MTTNRHTMGEAKLLYADSKEIVPAHEYDALAAEAGRWRADNLAQLTRIRDLEAELAEAKLQRDSWKRIAESGLGITAETSVEPVKGAGQYCHLCRNVHDLMSACPPASGATRTGEK